MNEIILLCILMICLLYFYFNNDILKEKDVTIIATTASILSFILSFKYIKLSNLITNSNIIIYSTMFISICLLLERQSKKKVINTINLIFFINIICGLTLYLLPMYTQSLNDTVSINMKNVFNDNYKVLLFYPLTIWITQHLLVLVYKKTKKIYDNLFISMTTTYLCVGLVDSIVFSLLCYYNELNNQTIIKIILSSYMPRLIVVVLFSIIFTYYTKKKVKEWII